MKILVVTQRLSAAVELCRYILAKSALQVGTAFLRHHLRLAIPILQMGSFVDLGRALVRYSIPVASDRSTAASSAGSVPASFR
jgi:hypothetical protein